MNLILKIESDNAAFQDGNAGAEAARILREAAVAMERGVWGGTVSSILRDFNGNKVGTLEASHTPA
jgi:hypothetical protein